MATLFTVRNTPPILARVPLRPADTDNSWPLDSGVFKEAVFLASRQVSAAYSATTRPAPDAVDPVSTTLRAYQLRSRWRPTPHGAFAGVATARVAEPGEPAGLRLGTGHRPRTYPTGAWLAALGDLLLSEPAVVRSLWLTTSNLVVHRGTLLEHECPTRRVTVRATEATLLTLRVCGNGSRAADVVETLTQRWPVPEPVITDTLARLIRNGFLLSNLLPLDITDDALGQVLGRLPDPHELAGPLTRLRHLLSDADQSPVGGPARLKAVTEARDLADAISFVDRPLSVDIAVDAHISVPTTVAEEAARAAGVLWRTGGGSAPLSDWHDQFVKRYGPDRLVPLLEATDSAIGLGIGTATADSRNPPTAKDTVDEAIEARRHGLLAGLVAQAVTHSQLEILLDDATIAALGSTQVGRPPRTAEIGVRVLAAAPEDLIAGRWQLAVVPPHSSHAGSVMGRFARLLPDTREPNVDDVLIAEIVTQACAPQGAGLVPPTDFTRCRIPVGVPARSRDLDLADLHLISDGRQLWCWSISQDRPVIPVLYSQLAAHLLPPVARFLQMLGQAGSRPLHGWSWGPLAGGPFQPRVRHGRTILAPARWVLPSSLTRTIPNRTGWNATLDAWRTTMVPPPPDVVVTDDSDRRLPLDLRRSDDRELLRRYVRRGLSAVCEQPGGTGAVHAVVTGPAGRHVVELIVPLAARTARKRPAPQATVQRRAASDGLFLPGGPWLSLAVRAPFICHEEILIRLADLIGDLAGQIDSCFWLRFTNAAHGPHLRVRFRGDPGILGGTVLPTVSAWCDGLIQQRLSGGFTIDPYDQEIERYGGPDAISAAEHVFSADSTLVLSVLTATANPDQRLLAAATSAAAVAHTVADADLTALGDRRLDPAARRRLEELRPHVRATRPHDLATPPLSIPVQDAWSARQDALVAYRTTLKAALRAACASSLIHMHANRLLGNATLEPLTRALAADILSHPPLRTP